MEENRERGDGNGLWMAYGREGNLLLTIIGLPFMQKALPIKSREGKGRRGEESRGEELSFPWIQVRVTSPPQAHFNVWLKQYG
jgi:hypothetical protein